MNDAKMEQAAESTLARLFYRFGTPILLAVAVWFLNGISSSQRAQADTQAAFGKDIAAIKSDVRDIGTRMDVQVLAQLQDLRKRIERVEAQQKEEITP